MRVLRQKAPNRRWALKGDRRANMQMIETMIVGLLIVGAVVAVTTIDVPSTKTEGFKSNNQRLVQDSLLALTQHPSVDPENVRFGSLLEEYVMEAAAGNPGPLMSYLNKTLPAGAQYNVFLDNGFGKPSTLVRRGAPPREAVAGSLQFVPELAYSFMVTDFASYHGDFDMTVHSLPIRHGAVQHDEGSTVELAVTFAEGEGDPVTMRTYGQTALRFNDATARKWPSVSMYHDGAGGRDYYVDATGSPGLSPEDLIQYAGSALSDIYNITFPIRIEETADVLVPEGAQFHLVFPRGWDFNLNERDWFANHTEPGSPNNAKFWEDITWSGNWKVGWEVTGKLKDGFKQGHIWLNVSGWHGTIIDTAYPYFTNVKLYMGSGVQGMSTIIVEPPAPLNVVGALKRDLWLSPSKPLISDDVATWGIGVTNRGAITDIMKIHSVELRQPEGHPILKDVSSFSSWVPGTWTKVGTSHYKWTPNDLQQAELESGEAAWISASVRGGHTLDNSYRNQDYMSMFARFNPDNGTGGPNTLGAWEFVGPMHDMSEEWIFRATVPPSDADGGNPGEYLPGWADESLKTYWVTGQGQMLNFTMPGNLTYLVSTVGAASNTFGDYQGSHVFSTLDVVGSDGLPKRDYGLDEKVYIKNDFSALFGRLSVLDQTPENVVSDLEIRSSVYTPEKAWKQVASAEFKASAEIAIAFENMQLLAATDIDDDGRLDLLAADDQGLVFALDGRDGTKFWSWDSGTATYSIAVSDFDADGNAELLVGQLGRVIALDTRPNLPQGVQTRELWVENLVPVPPVGGGTYRVLAMEVLASGVDGRPDLAVAISATTNDARLHGLDVKYDGSSWDAVRLVEYDSNDIITSQDLSMVDVAGVRWDVAASEPPTHVAVASSNRTVLLVDSTTFAPVWVTKMNHHPYEMLVGDLDLDGKDDIVVDTHDATLTGEGTHVYVLLAETGHWGTRVRPNEWTEEEQIPLDWAVLDSGGVFSTVRSSVMMQDHTGLYRLSAEMPVRIDDPLFGAGDGLIKWSGVYGRDGDAVYIVSTDGEVRRADVPAVVSNRYDWVRILLPQNDLLGQMDFMDLHVPPGPDSVVGPFYFFDSDGEIWWIEDKSVSADAEVVQDLCVDSTFSCNAQTQIPRWWPENNPDDTLKSVLVAAVNPGSTSEVFRFTPPETWTSLASFPGVNLYDIYVDAQANLWVVGDDTAGNQVVAYRPLSGGVWTYPRILSPSPSDELTSVVKTASGETWIASGKGRAWRLATGTDVFVPYIVHGFTFDGNTTLIVDADDRAWLIGEDFETAPLFTYHNSAWAYFPKLLDQPYGFRPTHLKFESSEGVLGGEDFSPPRPPNTVIEWSYRIGTDPTWHSIDVMNTNEDNGIVDRLYPLESLGCITEEACRGVEMRARLVNRAVQNGTDPLGSDGGASPLIRDFKITLQDLTNSLQVSFEVDEASLQPGSTTIYSKQARGVTLPVNTQVPWGYVGLASRHEDKNAQQRSIALSKESVVDGTPGPDVIILENATWTNYNYVLDGRDGRIERPTAGGALPLPGANDDADKVIVVDVDLDGIEDVVYAGYESTGKKALLRVWYPKDEVVHGAPNAEDSSDYVRALVDAGINKQRQSFAYIGDADWVTWAQGPAAAAQAPTVQWSTDPSNAQGMATFVYEIPDEAMFGTAVVVSELAFTVTNGAQQVTQTARLLDWFNITPPNEKVPRPPVYTVEVVSWFNEV